MVAVVKKFQAYDFSTYSRSTFQIRWWCSSIWKKSKITTKITKYLSNLDTFTVPSVYTLHYTVLVKKIVFDFLSVICSVFIYIVFYNILIRSIHNPIFFLHLYRTLFTHNTHNSQPPPSLFRHKYTTSHIIHSPTNTIYQTSAGHSTTRMYTTMSCTISFTS